MTQPNPISRFRPVIRVFVSSTFSDLKPERNALQAQVFPRLEQLCAQNGFQFQAIDLRWGVSSEAGLNHRTMRICFDELRRAQEISPRPNFLILLGNRYGWRPLPEEISVADFQALERAATQIATNKGPSATVLRTWYRKDENAVPPVYLLQSRRQQFPDAKDYTQDAPWNEVQAILWEIINRAQPPEQLRGRFDAPALAEGSPPAIVRFQASATEQEIWHGALRVPDAKEHVLAFFRQIENVGAFSDTAQIKDFVDLEPSGSIDAALGAEQNRLKEALQTQLGEKNIFTGSAQLVSAHDAQGKSTANITTDHLAQLCADVENRLTQIIRAQIEEYWNKSAQGSAERAVRELKIEQDEHKRFGRERGGADSFVGRRTELHAIRDYVQNDSTWPLVVYGASGCGKTALMARAAEEIQKSEVSVQKPEVIVRFIGVTPRSSDIRSLLRSLCQQMRGLHQREGELPTDINELSEELLQHFQSATPERPLILFLDALDQLSDADNGRLLNWIPTGQSPPHVKLVVSCLSDRAKDDPAGQPFAELTRRQLIAKNSINLDALSEDEASTLLFKNWLHQAGREVSDQQRERIEQILKSKECRQPIYLKLLFEEARLWHSYDAATKFGESVPAILGQLIERLSQPANHGKLLVERVLGYLAASRHGLAENEILEVLFADPEYKAALDDATKEMRHELPASATRIPIAIWSRLRFDLAPYLTERAAPGANVLTFYHRQVAEWVQEHFVKAAEHCWQPHRRLADYFRNLADPEKNQSWKGDSPRPFLELPFHLARVNADELATILFDFNWLQAKTDKTLVIELIQDYDEALYTLPANHPQRRALELVQSGLRLSAGVLTLDKGQLRTQLCGRLMGHISQIMQGFLSSLPKGGCWLRLLTPSLEQAGGLLLFSLSGHTDRVFTVALNEEGTIAVSGSEDGSLRVWNTGTGEELYKLGGHTGRVNGVALTRDGSRAVSVSDDQTVKVWDLSKGNEFRTLKGHTGVIRAVAITRDGKRIISISSSAITKNRELKIWELVSGNELQTLTSEEREMSVILIADNGKAAIYPLKNKVVDLQTGEQLTTLKRFEPDVISTVISADGRRVIISSDRALKAWDEVKIDDWSILEFLRHAGKAIGKGLPTGEVMAVSVLIGETRGLCGVGDTALTVWDLSSEKRLQLKGHTAPINAVAVTSDGSRALSASFDGTLKLWDLKTGNDLVTLEGHTGPVHDVAITANGMMAVSASLDKSVRVWNLSALNKSRAPTRHMGRINDLVVTADGRHLISASADHALKIWDIVSGEVIHTLQGHFKCVNTVAVSLGGERVISASDDYTLRVWNLHSGRLEHILEPDAGWLWAIAISPDGKIAVSSSSKLFGCALKVWDLVSGRELYTLQGHSDTVFVVTTFAGGSRAISASADKTLKIWDLSHGSELHTLVGHSAPVFDVVVSKDGSRAVSVSTDEILKVWDISSGKSLLTFGDRRIKADRLHGDLSYWIDNLPGREMLFMFGCPEGGGTLALTSDGTVVAYASKQNTIVTWNLLTGEKRTLTGHSDQIRWITVTSDDARIVSASKDRTVRVWNLKTGHLIAAFVGDSEIRACVITSDGLTVIAGEDSGLIHFLKLENAPFAKEGKSPLRP